MSSCSNEVCFLPEGMSLTENGALAYGNLGSDLLFVFANSTRNSFEKIVKNFENALDDPTQKPYAIILLYHIRDIRNGKGERALFYSLFATLRQKDPSLADQLLSFIPEFGYWGDMVKLYIAHRERDVNLSENVVKICAAQLQNDLQALEDGRHDLSLVSKWLPRENNKRDTELHRDQKKMIKDICRVLGWTNGKSTDFKKYRKSLTSISGCKGRFPTIESIFAGIGDGSLSLEESLSLFDPAKIPSVAVLRLRYALQNLKRNGETRDHLVNKDIRVRLAEVHKAFLEDCAQGKQKIKAGACQGLDLAREFLSCQKDATVEAQISSFIDDIRKTSKENAGLFSPATAMAIVDVSGSMTSSIPGTNVSALNVAIFLGYILSQLAEASFRNKLITFSKDPTWINLDGKSHNENANIIASAQWGMNTDIEKAFRLILNSAMTFGLPPDKMIKTLYVFSDMQFDCADKAMAKNQTVHQRISEEFEKNGYQLPTLVYWNLQANSALPVNAKTKNTMLMSGFSPNLFKAFFDGTLAEFTPENPPTPEEVLRAILLGPPYAKLREFLESNFFPNFFPEN